MLVIDSHQHFWQYHPGKHSWINDEMARLRRDFSAQDLKQVYLTNGVTGCIAVQADQSETETNYLLNLANQHEYIRGVVGWVDLCAENVLERITHYSQFKKVVGFRHVVQDEPDPHFMLSADFQRGLSALEKFGLTYDILIYPTQLESALKVVQQFPNLKFVINHMAKPYIAKGKLATWRDYIQAIARFQNVYCKISGMVTEADWQEWKHDDFLPYLDVIFSSFGVDRIMFGSDWPVCLLGGNYQQIKGIIETYVSSYSQNDQAKIWAGNACEFYGIDLN